MTDTLPIQPWMRAPATAEVMAALIAAGGPECARFVGGCVRDTLIGAPVGDIDIATTLTPEEVTAALVAAGLKAVPTGAAHGTITAISRGKPFEITTLRRDVETDGRHAKVAFTDDWAADAARRDFRLNALYADIEGRLFDPTGEGAADARAGRVVFVGDPGARIAEDALRILRFFRFLALATAVASRTATPWPPAPSGPSPVTAPLLRAGRRRAPQALERRGSARRGAAHGRRRRPRPGASRGRGTALEPFQKEPWVAIETDILFTCDPDLRLAALIDGGPDGGRRRRPSA